MGQMDTQLRYHLGFTTADLNSMSVAEWVRQWVHLKHIREKEAEANKPKK